MTRGFSPFLPKFDGTVYAGRIATTNCWQSDISALLLCSFFVFTAASELSLLIFVLLFSLAFVWAVYVRTVLELCHFALFVTHAGRLDRDALRMTDISECNV